MQKTAQKYSLPFVDNRSVFDTLIAKQRKGKYFADLDHCTIEGHRVMAQNIYNVLVEEGIVSKQEHLKQQQKL